VKNGAAIVTDEMFPVVL